MTNKEIARAYYTAMGEKNITAMAQYLDKNVQLVGPLGTRSGKDAVLQAIEKHLAFFYMLTIHVVVAEHEHVMMTIDMKFPAPVDTLQTAVHLTLHNELITHIELFFDASKFGTHTE
ncbi:nuclear transport factor 2 family protein [Candidatus Babeliales bacterium]|nr:nuclear transport factor 2 family protein [Candidatus Babeliales bacterium]